MSKSTISRAERGHIDQLSVATLRRIAAALDIRVEVRARWRAGDLDRLLNARHSEFAEEIARHFGRLPGWVMAPEVSFAIYDERGIIDILAWHAGRRALLVVEIKTDIVDVNEPLGTLDRKRRLAAKIAAERGWRPLTVGCWLDAAGRTNEGRIAAHRAMLRAALPDDGRSMRRWLRDPHGSVAALSMWIRRTERTGTPQVSRRVGAMRASAARHRVRRPAAQSGTRRNRGAA